MQVNFLSTTIAIMIGLWVMTTFVTISTFPVAYMCNSVNSPLNLLQQLQSPSLINELKYLINVLFISA